MTNCPCGDVIAGIRLHEAECNNKKRHQQNLLDSSPYRDGDCQNKPVVKRTIAALCAYDDQVLGKYLSEQLRNENSVDFIAQNLVAFQFKQFINFHSNRVLRLLFVFKMLTSAFNFRRSRSSTARNPCQINDFPSLFEQGQDNNAKVQGQQNTLDQQVSKCGFCAGRRLQGSKINHSLGKYRQGRARQQSIHIGKAIFAEGIKTQGSCARYGAPREFCNRWAKLSDRHWQLQSLKRCQYRGLVYNTVISLFQCSDTRYAQDLLTTIKEEGEEEYHRMGDKEVSRQLAKKLVVSGVEGAEIVQQLQVWTQIVHKAYIK